MGDVTRILSDIESGDPAAAEQLLPLVYDELRKLARAKLRHEQPGQTLTSRSISSNDSVRLQRRCEKSCGLLSRRWRPRCDTRSHDPSHLTARRG